MKIKTEHFFGFFLWLGLVSLIISPSFSTVFSLPRLDTALMPVYLLLTVFLFFIYKLEKIEWNFLVYFLLLILFAFSSLILNFSFDAFVDVCFYSFILFLFFFSLQYVKLKEIKKIRLIIFVLSTLIILGFLGYSFLLSNTRELNLD